VFEAVGVGRLGGRRARLGGMDDSQSVPFYTVWGFSVQLRTWFFGPELVGYTTCTCQFIIVPVNLLKHLSSSSASSSSSAASSSSSAASSAASVIFFYYFCRLLLLLLSSSAAAMTGGQG